MPRSSYANFPELTASAERSCRDVHVGPNHQAYGQDGHGAVRASR